MPSRAVQCDGFLTMTGGEGCDVGPPNIGTWGITDILVGGPEGFAVRVEDSRTVIADPEIDREEADTGSRNPLDEFAGVLVERADHIDRNSLADDSIQVTPSVSDRSISTDGICAATPLPGLTTNWPLRTGVLLVTSTSKISAFGKVNPSAGVPDAIAVTRWPR